MVSKSLVFNLEATLSHSMQKALENTKNPNCDSIFLTFYMIPYFLGIICTRSTFLGRSWFWNIGGVQCTCIIIISGKISTRRLMPKFLTFSFHLFICYCFASRLYGYMKMQCCYLVVLVTSTCKSNIPI